MKRDESAAVAGPDELRSTVDEGHARLDQALQRLARVSTAQMTLGGRMARAPWAWLAGAGLCGLLLGLREGPRLDPQARFTRRRP